MAEIPVYTAEVTVADQTTPGGFATVSLRVSEVDGQAWVAAANTAARAATKVGLLQAAVFNLMRSSQQKSFGVHAVMVNDAWVRPAITTDTYNSNKLNVSVLTSVGGIPRQNQFTIPQRQESGYALESNGINVVLDDAGDVAALIVEILDTMLSSYGTAITSVPEITVNDQ